MMNEQFLSFDNVNFSYPGGDKTILDSFSMSIAKGSVTAVLGPNGTGKTTMLLLSLCWLKPNSGNISILSNDLSELAREKLGKTISLVPQFEQISFDFSILDYVLMGRTPYISALQMPKDSDYEIALSALKKVGLEHKANNSVQKVSGGEKQLILLARALAQETQMLLLDEPTSHLDIRNKSRLMKILKELAVENKTIILTTHEPNVAASVASHIVLVKDGKVFKWGQVGEIMTSENLSEIYEVPVIVEKLRNNFVFLWE